MYLWTFATLALATLYGFATDKSGQFTRSIFRDGLTYLNPPVFKIQELYIFTSDRDFSKDMQNNIVISRQMFRIECKDGIIDSASTLANHEITKNSIQLPQSSGCSAAQRIYGGGAVGLVACSRSHLSLISNLLQERNPEIYTANATKNCKSNTEWVLREVLDASSNRLAIVLGQTEFERIR